MRASEWLLLLYNNAILGSIKVLAIYARTSTDKAEKSKCTVKVTSTSPLGGETVQEASGTYSCASDSFSGGKMFRLNAVFKGAAAPHLRKIEWAYPISMNAEKNAFSINVYTDAKKDTLVRLTLNKTE